ncbi:hypothetical protein [Bradyrhizobium japonicum]|uniref:hypothetical protein n=1 Tax=Bradyrhizobium japonicum TaxID=375 RepID=UPI00209DCDD3|nr:hypothetical protein [Bradyrhizobium japonicum]MCP1783888.1 hypothetical protein [Bradyrhizobium japonicum]MCP1963824.1 hypothetical protein [Bradyrhizobium japonicum]
MEWEQKLETQTVLINPQFDESEAQSTKALIEQQDPSLEQIKSIANFQLQQALLSTGDQQK